MRQDSRRRDRGFTMVELMIVVGVIGVLASIAIPNYQKLTARSRRAEMLTAVGKLKFFFKNAHDNNGTFEASDVAVGSASAVNPDPTLAPLGQMSVWDSHRVGWSDMPFGLDGGLRMRYLYKVNSKDEIEFEACGAFPGFGPLTATCGDLAIKGNYFYDEKFEANGTSTVVEFPNAF